MTLCRVRSHNAASAHCTDAYPKNKLKLYTPFNNRNPNSVHLSLDLINNWSVRWQLQINRSKTQHLNLGAVVICPAFSIDANRLPAVDNKMDLGINTASKLRYFRHISSISTKAISRSVIIHRQLLLTKYVTSSSCLYYLCPTHSRILPFSLEP